MLRDNAGINTTAYKLAVSTLRMNAESRFSSTGAQSPQSSLYRGAIAAHVCTVASEFKEFNRRLHCGTENPVVICSTL